MHSQPLSRRYLAIIRAALVALALLALLGLSGTYAAPKGLRLDLNLDALNGSGALQMRTGERLADIVSPRAAFDALNQQAGGTLDIMWDHSTGVPRFLAGNSSSVRIPYTPTAAELGNPSAIARGFLDANRALFGLESVAADFAPGRIEPDMQLGFSNVRLRQMYKGIPVFGRQLIVHLDAQERIVAVNGQYSPGLSAPTQPSLTKVEAEQVALDDLRANQLGPDEQPNIIADVLKEKTALTVYIDEVGKATLTWRVQVRTTSPLGAWTIFVNARRPVVTHAIDGLAHAKERETYSARNGTNIPGRLLLQEGERSNDPVAQAAHDAAGTVYDYYSNTFKRDGVDGRGSPIISTVHYGSDPEDAENAAWISEAGQMVYGDGGRIFKPLAYGLDVVGHELTHGVTENTAQLIYEGQSGALNESYSDIFGAMIDRSNWTVGEAVVKSPPYPVPYLRSLQDPTLGGNYDPSNPLSGIGQPGTMRDYANLPLSRRADNGGVHINSGIPSHAAFFVAQAIGKEKMEQIYYRTLTQYLSPDADFLDAGRATVQAATDLYGAAEANAVRDAFRQVGIDLGGSSTVPSTPVPSTTTTPVPSSSPVPGETLPEGCREMVVNGSFERSGGWNEVTSGHTQIIDPELPHTGSQSAWLGGTDQESLLYIYQDIALPANATSVRVSYFRLLHTELSPFLGLFASDATFTVLLADTNGNELATLETISSAGGDDTWRQAQFDLSRYAGQTVRLVFAAENPRGNLSSLFVDDVSVAACTTGAAPSTPITPQDQVYINGYIQNADTGRALAGAQIFILKPGLTATSAAADGDITDNEVLTYGTSDGEGFYETGDPVPRGQVYSVILVADGYRPVIADNGIDLPPNASNPTEIDAVMRVAR
jgi:Zn-dependent metalloprotease